jgi:nucleoid DNA-binding protein
MDFWLSFRLTMAAKFGAIFQRTPMNIERFKSKLARNVAAKAGITPEQAKEIVHHVVELPSEDIEKTLELSELGKCILINRKVTGAAGSEITSAIEIPYEAVAKFKVGKKFKKLTFRDLQQAKLYPSEYYEPSKLEKLITLGGLEGDSDVPVRRPGKELGTVGVQLEGNQDTPVRRPG